LKVNIQIFFLTKIF